MMMSVQKNKAEMLSFKQFRLDAIPGTEDNTFLSNLACPFLKYIVSIIHELQLLPFFS